MISFSEKWLSKIFQNKIFFPHIRIFVKIENVFGKKKLKKISKKIFEKILCAGKNILVCKIFESHFSENEIIEN